MSVAGGLAGQGGADHISGIGQAWLHGSRQQNLGVSAAGASCPSRAHVEGAGAEATDAAAAAVSPPREGAAAPGVRTADLAHAQGLLGPLDGADDDQRALGWT